MAFTPEAFLDELLSLPGLMRPKASPDGKWIAWSWSRVGPAADVFLAPSDGSAPPMRMTHTSDDTFVASWSPDSQALIVGQDHKGDERVRLFAVDVRKPCHMRPLTQENPPFFLRGGQLHPNGQWLVYAANRDPDSGEGIEQTLVYRQDLKTGEMRCLARPEKGAYIVPSLSPDGEMVLYGRKDRHPSGKQLWVVDIEGQGDSEIANVGDALKVDGYWLADSSGVLLLAETATHRKVGVWDRVSGLTRWLIDDADRNFEGAVVPKNGGLPVLVEVVQACKRLSFLDPTTGKESVFGKIKGNLVPVAPIGERHWVGIYESATQPSDLVSFSLDDLRVDALHSVTRLWERTRLTPGDLSPAEDYRWRSVDGLPIQGWLYRAGPKARGTIVHVHGGPTAHSEDRLRAEIQYYVKAGFNVLDPNYRGSTGFGLPFQEKVKEDGWGGREQDDILYGIKALMEEGVAQPYAVGMTGTSYGGYSSWCAITRFNPEELIAAAPICGMTDLVVDYHTTRPDLRPYSEEMMGGSPDDVPDRYKAGSPIHYVSGIRGQLLIVQGAKDPNVTDENVREVLRALGEAEVSYETLIFADEGHGIRRTRNQRWLYVRLAQFFAQAFDQRRHPGEG